MLTYTTQTPRTGMADESVKARFGLMHMSKVDNETKRSNIAAPNLEKQ
jgi:hypothetical protein